MTAVKIPQSSPPILKRLYLLVKFASPLHSMPAIDETRHKHMNVNSKGMMNFCLFKNDEILNVTAITE